MKDLISMGLKSTKASDAGRIRDKGFTLIELLVSLAIASIFMAAIYSVYAGLTRSYTTQNAAADAQQAVRATIDFMAEDIMLAGLDSKKTAFSDTILPIRYADSTKIWIQADRNMNGEIEDVDLEMITYVYDSADDRLDQILYEGIITPVLKEDTEVFMDNVTEFSFTYLDAGGNDLGDPVPAADLDNIRTVVISMKVEEPAGRENREEMKAREYSTWVKCRNLGLDD
jgi:type IV pilus assembly protein PilW